MSEARPQPAKHRSRKNMKHLHAHVKLEAWVYVNDLAGEELGLAQAVEFLVDFHRSHARRDGNRNTSAT